MTLPRKSKGSTRIAYQTSADLISHTQKSARARASTNRREFDAQSFLDTIGEGRKVVCFPKGQTVFVQGDPADALFYLQTGEVRLSVVSSRGKEATIGVLSDGSFFGENALANQPSRLKTATALTNCVALRIEKIAMVEALHREHTLSDLFVAFLLAQNIRHEEDLVDHLFNSSEKRLARVLLALAQLGKQENSELVTPKLSQESLAEMVGTTRSRVSFFMNRFRKLGFIDYAAGPGGRLQVHSSLLDVIVRG